MSQHAVSAHCIEVGHHAESAHFIEVGHHAGSAHCIEVGHHADSAHCIEVGHHADPAHCKWVIMRVLHRRHHINGLCRVTRLHHKAAPDVGKRRRAFGIGPYR